MASGGRWLDPATRSELAAVVRTRRYLSDVCDFRDRLVDLTARNRRDMSTLAEELRRWCADAEASGIRVLVDFAAQLKGCRVVEQG